MNKLTISVGAAAAAGAVALVGVGVNALATTAPPHDVHSVGALTLQSGGAPVTSGSLAAVLPQAVGDAHLPAGTRAVLYAYVYGDPTAAPTAVSSFAPGGVWTGSQLTAATAYSGTPSVTPDASSQTLAQFVGAHHLPANGLVELRLRTVSGGTASDDYDALDIYVSGSTWSTTGGVSGSPSGSPSTSPSGSASPTTTPTSTPTSTPTNPPTTPAATPVAASVTEKVAKKVKHTAKVKLVATVTAPGVVPTGTVTVLDGKKALASKTLGGGKATFKLKKLKRGKHKITTTYSGSSTVGPATSKTITVTSK